jgi:transmembrane sensor
VLVCIGSWSYLQRGVYSTDIGEQRTLALTDGSTVELNARTKIRVAYTDQTRTIELLEGQALFKVAKDPNRPFVVGSDGTRVRAVGTQFDVYKKSNGTQVTVVEGRVALTVPASGVLGVSGLSREVPTAHRGSAEETQGFSGSSRPPNGVDATNIGDTAPASTERASHALQVQLGEVLLSAGEQLTVSAVIPANARIQEIQSVPVPQLANIEATTAWTQQRFVFDFTPLTEVADEFNRYNRRRLIIDDPTLETFNVSGSFSSTDPTLLLRFLREQPEIVLNESATEIRISRLPDNTGP